MGQMFDQPDHVIAKVAKKTGGGLGQIIGQGDARFRDDIAETVQRIAGHVLKGIRIIARRTVQCCGLTPATPDQVGLHADDGIASAHVTACDRLQHKGILRRAGKFEHQRHGRVEICGKAGVDDLVFARFIGAGESVEIRGQGHQICLSGKVHMHSTDRALVDLGIGIAHDGIAVDIEKTLGQRLI